METGLTYSCTMLGLCIGLFVSGNETVVESLTLKPTRVEQHQGLLTWVATASSRDGDVARPRDQRHLFAYYFVLHTSTKMEYKATEGREFNKYTYEVHCTETPFLRILSPLLHT